jgi:hypothetical protein
LQRDKEIDPREQGKGEVLRAEGIVCASMEVEAGQMLRVLKSRCGFDVAKT